MCKSYHIDHINQKVFLKASFIRAAGRMGSREYNELLALRRELPDYEFKPEETNRKKTTSKNKNLTYGNMRSYIEAAYADAGTAPELLKTLDKVISLSKIHTNPYKYVRDWFMNQCPNYNSTASLYNSEEHSASSEADLSDATI